MGLYERDYYQDSEELNPIRPWDGRSIVSTLIVINVAVFLANFIFGGGTSDPVNQPLWLQASDLFQPMHWYKFLTNGFAHSRDVTHILFNMLSLYLLGKVVESKYGRGEFLRFYLITIVICSLGWALRYYWTIPADQLDNRYLIGASGGVTAITMLFVFNFPNATLMAFGVLPIKSWVYGLFIIAMNVMGTANYEIVGAAGNTVQTAYDVHLIGAACAALYFYGGLSFGAIGTMWSKFVGLTKSKPKLKIHEPNQTENAIPPSIQAEADRVLDKLHREGQDSLTAKERKTLEEYSRAVRKLRQQ